MLLKLQQSRCEFDVWLQEVLGVQTVALNITSVLLNVQTNGSARAARSRKTDNDARSIGELDIETLVRRNAAIEIGVREVTSIGNYTVLNPSARIRRKENSTYHQSSSR